MTHQTVQKNLNRKENKRYLDVKDDNTSILLHSKIVKILLKTISFSNWENEHNYNESKNNGRIANQVKSCSTDHLVQDGLIQNCPTKSSKNASDISPIVLNFAHSSNNTSYNLYLYQL